MLDHYIYQILITITDLSISHIFFQKRRKHKPTMKQLIKRAVRYTFSNVNWQNTIARALKIITTKMANYTTSATRRNYMILTYHSNRSVAQASEIKPSQNGGSGWQVRVRSRRAVGFYVLAVTVLCWCLAFIYNDVISWSCDRRQRPSAFQGRQLSRVESRRRDHHATGENFMVVYIYFSHT